MSKAQSRSAGSKNRESSNPPAQPTPPAPSLGERVQGVWKPLQSGLPGRLILDGQHDRVPQEQRVSSGAKLLLGGYLVGVTVLCLQMLLLRWPDPLPTTEVLPKEVGDYERGLLRISMLAGGLGACIHALQSIGAFLGERTMMRSWVPWYFLRPFLGMGLAFMAFVVLAGGLVQGNAAALNPFGVAAISALAGLFSRRAIQKLAEVCDTIFQLGNEDERSGTLTQDPEQEDAVGRSKGDPPKHRGDESAPKGRHEPEIRTEQSAPSAEEAKPDPS